VRSWEGGLGSGGQSHQAASKTNGVIKRGLESEKTGVSYKVQRLEAGEKRRGKKIKEGRDKALGKGHIVDLPTPEEYPL